MPYFCTEYSDIAELRILILISSVGFGLYYTYIKNYTKCYFTKKTGVKCRVYTIIQYLFDYQI